ncbi:MAG: outer membrane protein assembly factor BamD [Bdellovibrionaceae bacterium]|nr:outer membrane protein assembly factor BamD [Pseudobdellovibrionaceae bacterium]
MVFQLLFSALIGSAVIGCSSSSEIDTATPEGAYKLAEKYEKDERFEEAIAQYSQVKNKHPYSKLATEAELRIAEIHFKREEYIESQNAYQVFKDLHPSYPKIDYVTFRLGLSFYNQLPSTIDRDLAVAERAILYFDEVTQSFPNSAYVKEAQDHKIKALKMLAEKEYYIGNFYFIRDHFESALGRFEELLERYPNLGLDAKALYGAAISAHKIKDMAKTKTYYQKLTTRFKGSEEAEKARREIGSNI